MTATRFLRWIRLCREKGGNVAVITALAIPALMAVAGAVIDFSNFAAARHRLQGIADGAALASAQELRIATSTPQQVSRVAEAYARGVLGEAASSASIAASVAPDRGGIVVEVSQEVTGIFSRFLNQESQKLKVRSVARVSGTTPICIIGLDTGGANTVYLEKRAHITAEKCAIYSNSKSTQGLRAGEDAVIKASLICSAGGKVGTRRNFSPEPTTDCPVMPDPLASRPAPLVGVCPAKPKPKIVTGPETLSPGVYCGGLQVAPGGQAKLLSGTYVIQDGPLHVVDGGSLYGRNTGFYFTGKDAEIRFENKTTIDLTAPKDGTMAGMLFFEDRAAKGNPRHKISSDDARMLLGTIYLPRGRLEVDAEKPVADRSAYTVIVAERIELYAGPNLVLNSDYSGTDIPVPQGVGPNTAANVSLAE